MKKRNFYRTHLKLITGIALVGIFIFQSCDELEENLEGDLTANAGSDLSVEVGQNVSLDASGSTTSSGTLTYNWSFSGKPSGSGVTITNPTNVSASFTPDVEGDYIVQLTISNGTSTDTDEVTVTATTSSTGGGTIEVSGTLSSDETWTNHVSDSDTPDYLITGNLTLEAKLTIEPGVLIHVQEDVGVWVQSNGTLVSAGESGNEIIFTSANEGSSLLWKGIMVKSNSSLNKMEYTKVMYAGNSEFGFSGTDYTTAIGIEDGKLSLLNSTVSHSGDYGLFLHSGEIPDFSANTFRNNTNYDIRINAEQAGSLDNMTSFSDPSKAVEIYHSTLNSTDDIQWETLSSNARYYVSGSVTVDSYLEIAPGALFDFAENIAIYVGSSGVFVADASAGEKIVFTSKNASTDVHWKGIYINSNDSRNILNNAEVSFAGSQEWNFSGYNYNSAVAVEDGKLSIMNSTISNSMDYGFYLHSGSVPEFASNTFDNNAGHAMIMMMDEVRKVDANTTFTNNGWDGVTIYNSTLSQESSWVDLSGDAMYRIQGWVYAENGLTIEAGADLAFDEDKALVVQGSGYFIAKGTSGNLVTFTSSNEAGQIYWAGIWIKTSDARNEMDYVEVNLAGGYEFNFSGYNYSTAIAGDDDDNPTLTLTNSTIKNSASYAVYWEGGTINDVESSAANNTFSNNAQNPDVVIP